MINEQEIPSWSFKVTIGLGYRGVVMMILEA